MSRPIARLAILILMCAVSAPLGRSGWRTERTAGSPAGPFDWREDWAVADGFSLQIDSEGYDFPTAIAFVPSPGPGAKDPLYFVAELRGRVKVVTRDRSVAVFAENIVRVTPTRELPDTEGQTGLAGLCLDPERGYVFVTFAYLDRSSILRNDIVRFQSRPRVFSLTPTAAPVHFSEIFAADVSAVSHQIGPCQVAGNQLFVSIGDGKQPVRSQDLASTLGKVLRMSVDGRPLPDNPFYRDSTVRAPRNYVWASGLRNPFSLKVLGDRVFVFENGPRVDRFLEIQRGANYLWNGTDWSVGTNAAAVLSPSLGPVQMDYLGAAPEAGPVANHFFAAVSADMLRPEKQERPGVVMLAYDLAHRRMAGVPKYFLEYRGASIQMVVGLAAGPDGLYIVPLFPHRGGVTTILKVRYDPSRKHPYLLGRDVDPVSLMRTRGCFGCHQLRGAGGTSAPPFDPPGLVDRLQRRLHSREYLDAVAALDRIETQPFVTYREQRRQVLGASGLERVRRWMRYQIQSPGFDNAFSQMPNLGVPEREAAIFTDTLIGSGERPLAARFPRPRFRHVALAFLAGALGGLVVFPLMQRLSRRVYRRRTKIRQVGPRSSR